MNSIKNYTWHKIAESLTEINFNKAGLATVLVNNKTICVALHQNKLFACNNKCPHASGNIIEGYIDVLGNVVCPLHKYKFNLHNGRNTSGEGYFLKTYAIEIRNEGIFVGFSKNNLFGTPK